MKDKFKKRFGLTVSLVLFVFVVMMLAIMISSVLVISLHIAGVLPMVMGEALVGQGPVQIGQGEVLVGQGPIPIEHDALPVGHGAVMIEQGAVMIEPRAERIEVLTPMRTVFPVLLISVLLGTTIALFLSRKILNPIRSLIDATHRVADGDFNVRVDLKGVHELESLSSSFNKMTHELSSIETLRSDFVNTISHEFKTPIVSIRGFAKLLGDSELSDEEKKEYIDIIVTESERLSALSTNILDLSKYENLEIIADKTEYRLDEQIRNAIVLTAPKWTGKGIDVNVIEMEEVIFTGNADLTQQIWLNLIDNAIKFTHKGGIITVDLYSQDNGIRFTIKDDGVGMDEQTQAHIFDKFYQGESSRAREGNGLGLSIVKRIVDLCCGTIEVQSTPGDGSEFKIWLPQ